MGCDIHSIAEVRDESGKWHKVGKVFKNQYYNPEEESKTDEDGYEWNPQFQAQPYGGRNYDLFAILADVRNGRGFAGVKTGEGFNPIAEPKGIPEDASKEGIEFMNSYQSDGHSHSYFTVKELQDYDWDQKTTIQGVITTEEYDLIKGTDKGPESWCGMVSGPQIVVSQIPDITEKTTHVIYRWGIAYKEHCQHFLNETIPNLLKLGSPENVRILFFFDN